MKKLLFTLFFLLTFSFVNAQDPKAYAIFDKDGHPVTYREMIAYMQPMDVVFFGEIHNCPIAHWMEKLVIADLYAQNGGKTALGAEMFERDNQVLVDEYLTGLINEDKFKAEAKLWQNYKTDYAPLLDFAKEKGIPFIATNVARRYANMVSKGGLQALEKISPAARDFIAPLPIKYIPNPLVDAYFAQMSAMGGSMGGAMKPAMAAKVQNETCGSINERLSWAQGVKDATMAWSISQHLQDSVQFIHINGSFHSTGHAGIINYLKVYAPGVKCGTIEVVMQKDIQGLKDNKKGHADFFICVPDDMTTTY